MYSSIAVIYGIIYLFLLYRMDREDQKIIQKYKKFEILMEQEEKRSVEGNDSWFILCVVTINVYCRSNFLYTYFSLN